MTIDELKALPGRLRLIDADSTYEEARGLARDVNGTGGSFFAAVKRFVKRIDKRGVPLREGLVLGTGSEFLDSLVELGEAMQDEVGVKKGTIESWFDSVRDPRRKANDPTPRLNFYRLGYLFGLNSRELIREFFAEAVGVDAFARLTPLEKCIERRMRLLEEGRAENGEWLPKALEDARLIESAALRMKQTCSDVVIASRSADENVLLEDEEYRRILASREFGEEDLKLACERVMSFAQELWSMCDGGSGHKMTNSAVVDYIFNDDIGNKANLLRPAADKVGYLSELDASRNFPTGKILGTIRSGEANPEQIRRMFLAIEFALVFSEPGTHIEARRKKLKTFFEESSKELCGMNLRPLGVSDGYDVLLLFCSVTCDPLDTLRRAASGGFDNLPE